MKRYIASILLIMMAFSAKAVPGDVQFARRWLDGGAGIEPLFITEPPSNAFWWYDTATRRLTWKLPGTGFDCSGVSCNVTAAAGPTGATGAPGASAYEIATMNGFVGNQASWLGSLVGPTGPAGTTDYTLLANKPTIPVINRAVITTASDGTYTWTYPTACSGTPVVQVTAQNNTSGETINHKVTAVSATSMTVATSRAVIQAPAALLGLNIPVIQTASAQTLHVMAICP